MDEYDQQNLVQIKCQICNYTVNQSSGAKRTICPQCGNFYNASHSQKPPEPRRKLRNHRADQRLLSQTHPQAGSNISVDVCIIVLL